MPGGAAVAARAVFEVVAAEGALVVVAGHATARAGRGVVHERRGRGDLAALRRARAHRVTVGAGQSLRRVRGVAEVDTVGGGRLRRAREATDAVARAARGDVLTRATLRARRVALEAGRVRARPRRDRERAAAPLGPVAGRAVRARAGVRRVVE